MELEKASYRITLEGNSCEKRKESNPKKPEKASYGITRGGNSSEE